MRKVDDRQEAIIKKYPKLFAEVDMSPQQTCMCWGLEFDEGWYDIFEKMCEEIEATGEPCVFQQTKEKYGGLRVYASCSDKVQEIIDKYERKSYKTCEICGMKAVLCHRGSWFKTLCKSCMKDAEYEVFKRDEN